MSIILFDGVCNLCNNVVSFLIKYDKNNVFKFAAIQTNAGENIIPVSYTHLTLPTNREV